MENEEKPKEELPYRVKFCKDGGIEFGAPNWGELVHIYNFAKKLGIYKIPELPQENGQVSPFVTGLRKQPTLELSQKRSQKKDHRRGYTSVKWEKAELDYLIQHITENLRRLKKAKELSRRTAASIAAMKNKITRNRLPEDEEFRSF